MASSPQLRALARRLKHLESQVLQRKQPTLGFSTIDDGALTAVDQDQNLTMIIGNQHDGTNAATVVTGPTPPAPSGVALSPTVGGLNISWDGTFEGGSVAPMDFTRVTFHAFEDPLDFTPLANLVGEVNSATGGTVFAALPAVEQYVFAVTWTLAGHFAAQDTPGFDTPLEPDAPVVVAPTVSPVPVPVIGPAAVVVNYTPVLGDVVDLHIWMPPALEVGEEDYATPTGVTPDSTTLHTEEFPPGGFVYTDVNGAPLPPDYPVWVALQARNATPPAAPASAWVQSSAGAIDPEYLKLLAGDVIATRLQGKTIQGVDIIGSTLDIYGGLIASEDGVQVKAELVEAQAAIFHDNVTRRGENNYLAGREVAAAGVTDPGTQATVTAHWPSVELDGSPAGAGVYVDTAAGEVFVLHANPSEDGISVYDLDTGALLETLDPALFEFVEHGYDITGDATWLYVAVGNVFDTRVHIYRYDRAAARDGTFDIDVMDTGNLQNPQAASIALANSRLHWVHISSGQAYRYRRWVISTQVAELSFTTLPDKTPSSFESIAGLTVDYSSPNYKVKVQPYNSARSSWNTDPSFALSGPDDRALPMGDTVVGASGNYTLDLFGTLYSHARDPDNLGEATIVYTWYDSDAGGADGVGESRPSPAKLYTAPKGAWIKVKTPLPPDDGTADAPNTVRVYINSWLQGTYYSPTELAEGRVFNIPVTTGTSVPTDSDFDDRLSVTPGGYASAEGDGDGPIWELNGTGGGRIGPYSWDDTGAWIPAPAIQLTPTMSGVASHNVYIKEIAPGVVACVGYLDVDDSNVTRRDTGMVIPVGMRPLAQIIDASPQFGVSGGKYRYFFGTDGMIEFEQSNANNGPFEGFSVVWFTA